MTKRDEIQKKIDDINQKLDLLHDSLPTERANLENQFDQDIKDIDEAVNQNHTNRAAYYPVGEIAADDFEELLKKAGVDNFAQLSSQLREAHQENLRHYQKIDYDLEEKRQNIITKKNRDENQLLEDNSNNTHHLRVELEQAEEDLKNLDDKW